jgi:predicted Zn-dependent peptidase
VVKRLTRADLAAFHQAWLRPSKGDDLRGRRHHAGGGQAAARTQLRLLGRTGRRAPVKSLAAAIPAPRPRILLVDRPASPQSMIMAGEVLGATGRDDLVPLRTANEVLGGSFLSRLNMDLREARAGPMA